MNATELESERPPNYRKTANCLSALTFWWTLKIFALGSKRDLYHSDLPEPLPEHKASCLGDKLAKKWTVEYRRAKKSNDRPGLGKVIVKCFAAEYCIYGLALAFMELLVKPLQPLFLGLVLRYFSVENASNNRTVGPPMYLNRLIHYHDANQGPVQRSEAYLFASGVVLCSVISCFIQHPFMMAVMHLGLKIRVACTSLIYRKILRMNLLMLTPTVVGKVVNLMSSDLSRFDMVPMFMHYLWISPTQMCLFGYILYFHVQISSLIGICTIVLFIPLQIILACINKYLRWRTATKTDERCRLMNEIIAGIQVIKMYGWEHAFEKLIKQARQRELDLLVRTSYIRGVVMSFIMFTARCGVLFTILPYVLMDQNITSEKAFVIVGYYILMRQCMTLYFPQGVTQFAETLITVRRIRDILMLEDAIVGDRSIMYDYSETRLKKSTVMKTSTVQEFGLRMFEACAKWDVENLVLDNIELSVKDREFVAVVGAVGSGKTSLLLALLQELPLCSGYISVKGSISYAAEEPWLFAGTIRQNILFGEDYARERYKRVIKVCALVRDFKMFPYGDQTFIGERGMSLSGGQKARINLARAVYKQANIYLLDNCLAAVDSQVGAHIFDKCISEFLSDRIVVLVTHQLQYLKDHHGLVLMDKGRIIAHGTYQQLQASGLDFAKLLQNTMEEEEEANETLFDVKSQSISTISQLWTEGSSMQIQDQFEEVRSRGYINCKVYKEYVKAGGHWCTVVFTAFMFLFSQALASGSDFFISQWMKTEEHKSHQEIDLGILSTLTSHDCIIYCFVLNMLLIVVSITRSFVFFTVCLHASLKLHNLMFKSILFSRMRFFFLNPSGRILNRFSKDMGAVDEDLPYALIDFFQITLNLVGVSVVIIILNYYLVIPTVLICVVFYFLRNYYLKTSTNVKRLEAMARSPVYAHFNASVQGLTTIRSHKNEVLLCEEFDKHQDIQSSAWFLFIATSRAFSVWLDCICTGFIGICTFSFLVFNYNWYAGDVGLGITQCITLTGLFPWGMRQSAEMENQLTSVERIMEFTKIEQEPDLNSKPASKPRPSWPERGEITFDDVELYYASNEKPILKKVNLHIQPKEKIGIVGRTGAGKSTLIAALFRFGILKGTIKIDNIDIKTIGLHDLRKRIAIIPQDPVIFSGSMRFNLDPFREFTDEHLLSLLGWVDLDTGQKDSLDRYLDEGGSIFSSGQKQLVCLARALVHNNRILIMDEATANMDPQTDYLIQQTIRTKFAHCTVLTIAHRLNTIMDSDRVLVLDAGKVIEFDHPFHLLNNEDGLFTSMLNQTGKAMSDTYKKMAQESYIQKYGSLASNQLLPKSSDLYLDDEEEEEEKNP